jgi:secreted protein
MKKMFLSIAMALVSLGAFAQTYKNEVKLNILNVIARPSIELGYEYYLDDNQSVDGELVILDKFSYWPKGDGKFSATSIKVGYNYYFDSSDAVGFYINPFLKTRFGKYTEEKTKNDNTKYDEETNLGAFIIGVGVGYTWVFNSKFVVAPYANIGRNFSSAVNERFWAVEPNAGVRLGFRF